MTMGALLLDGHARDIMNPWEIIIYYHYLPVLPGWPWPLLHRLQAASPVTVVQL
jgi:hypothetical protein